ncbi:MAG: hypothetical protein DMF20_08920 [Verrucomicrobia bacterium]|nr:MAG: hypothetical protein DMF20_08920 [Verrucomicrobiota bacterium]
MLISFSTSISLPLNIVIFIVETILARARDHRNLERFPLHGWNERLLPLAPVVIISTILVSMGWGSGAIMTDPTCSQTVI